MLINSAFTWCKLNYWTRLCAVLFLSLNSHWAQAFCGFYVGKADASLFNQASKVILARDGERTVISMSNDYQGELQDFALVVPVPEVLKREQINVGDQRIFDRIDAFSAPRMAEYFDENPCDRRLDIARQNAPRMDSASKSSSTPNLGVTIEARYTIGEYDIVILAAKESNALEVWLQKNGYKIPAGASRALKPYLNQGMKFFVAKVNLKEQANSGFQTLRPLQFAFETPKFMLPLRLGMVNAKGPQDLIVYTLTRQGRVESSNYRTVKLPANMDIPVYLRGSFQDFYKAMFDQQAKKEDYRVVFTEYFWDMSWCDPCAAQPLSAKELKQAGVFWLDETSSNSGGAQPVLLTRLHVRYTKETFPEDLMFHETKDRENFQARYVIRHPWLGSANECPAAKTYLNSLSQRYEQEAKSLSNLTSWPIHEIRKNMNLPEPNKNSTRPWWKYLWDSSAAR
jgi:hypothetical protein